MVVSYDSFAPVSVVPAVSAVMFGRDATSKDVFSFAVRPVGSGTSAAVTDGVVELPAAASVAGGFPQLSDVTVPLGGLKFLRPGIFSFEAFQTELDGLQPGVSAVTGSLPFAVTVSSNASGDLSAVVSDPPGGLRFEERYARAEATLAVGGVADFGGGDPARFVGGLKFGLSAVTRGAPLPKTLTVSSDAVGRVSFGDVRFTHADLESAVTASDGTRVAAFEYLVTQSGSGAGIVTDPDLTRRFTVKVFEDPATGSLTAVAGQAPLFSFEDPYRPKSAKYATPAASVVVAGWPDRTGASIDVELSGFDPATVAAVTAGTVRAGSQRVSVVAGAHPGEADFTDLVFDQVGRYWFRVAPVELPAEVTSADSCVFTVEVTDDGHGGLIAVAGASQPQTDCFSLTATFAPVSARLGLRGVVSLDSATPGVVAGLGVGELAEDYTYSLVGVSGAPLPSSCARPCVAVMDAAGNIDFGAAAFSREALAGATSADFTYRVTQAGSHLGVTNDPVAMRQFTVRVSEGALGELTAALVTPTAGVGFAFTNTYRTKPVTTAAVPASTELTGADGSTQHFDFEVVARGAATEDAVTARWVTLPAAEQVTGGSDREVVPFGFNGITFTRPGNYYFTARQLPSTLPTSISPVTGFVDFSVTVTDQGNGTLKAAVVLPTGGLKFVSVSPAGPAPTATPSPPPTVPAATSAEVEATGSVTMAGAAGSEQVGFRVVAVNQAAVAGVTDGSIRLPAATQVSPGGISAAVGIAAGKVGFDRPGRFQFAIVEDASGAAAGVTATTGGSAFTVEVTDPGTGVLHADLEPGADRLGFVNTYATTARPLQLLGRVTVAHPATTTHAPTAKQAAQAYQFDLTADPGTPLPDKCATSGCRLAADEVGWLDFGAVTYSFADLAGQESRTFTYRVHQTGELPGVVNDPVTIKSIRVTVTDQGDGTLVVAAADPVFRFVNTYTPAAVSIPVPGTWTLTGRDRAPGESFAFQLTHAGATAEPGVTLPSLATVETGRSGEPVKFSLGDLGFTEPGRYQFVARALADDPASAVTATLGEHSFTVEVADTGDGALTAELKLPAGGMRFTGQAASATTSRNLAGLQRLDLAAAGLNKTLADLAGQYQYQLTATEPDAPLPTTRTASNDALGAVTFGETTYTLANLAGARTRTFHYQVSQTGSSWGVVNDSRRNAEFTVTVATDDAGRLTQTSTPVETLFSFTNSYQVTPTRHALQATKTLTGRLLQAAEFRFQLTGGDGTTQTVANDAHGVITFNPISFTSPGTYQYVIAELKPDQPDIQQNTGPQTVTVTVADTGRGVLTAATDPANPVAFSNTCNWDPSRANSACEPDDNPTLANTGANPGPLPTIAAVLVLAGLALRTARHRKRRRSP